MSERIAISEITDPQEKSDSCTAIIHALPSWFGIPEANDHYIRDIADKDVFAALDGERTIGLLALKYHFRTNAEIWWLGVMPDHHGQGAGTALLAVARTRVVGKGCDTLLVSTLSDRSKDASYAKTRAFYTKSGFRPLVEYNETDPNPMVWMTLKL